MQDNTPRLPHKQLDILGVFISGLCAIHCAALPLLMAFLPLLGLSFLLNETLEKTLLVFAVTLALWSVAQGYKHHHRFILFGVWLGAALLIGAQWFLHHEVLAIGGALGLASCHFLNYRFLHTPITVQSSHNAEDKA